jgi:hypothetical protein
MSLAETLCRERAPAGAESSAREALAILRQTLPGGHPNIAQAESILGGCLTFSQDYEEAEPLLLGSYPVLKARTGGQSSETQDALRRIVRLYESWGRADRAVRYRSALAALGPGQGPGSEATVTGSSRTTK